MMHGHEKSDLVIVAMKPANKAREAYRGGVCGGGRSGVGGAKGGGQGEYAPAKARTGLRARFACDRRWRERRVVPIASDSWCPIVRMHHGSSPFSMNCGSLDSSKGKTSSLSRAALMFGTIASPNARRRSSRPHPTQSSVAATSRCARCNRQRGQYRLSV